MWNAGVLEPLCELDKVSLARDGEDDGVRVGRQVAGRGLAGSMDELGGEIAEAKVSSDDDVVIERLVVGCPARFCGAMSIK